MRTLYFDIDETLLDRGRPKALLAGGGFERLVRAAGVERLVCVGNAILVVRALERAGVAQDGLATVFRVCGGCFVDEVWFRAHCVLVQDPSERASAIDTSLDWFYVDDLAEDYCASAGRSELFARHVGERILVPAPQGAGADVVAWLRGLA